MSLPIDVEAAPEPARLAAVAPAARRRLAGPAAPTAAPVPGSPLLRMAERLAPLLRATPPAGAPLAQLGWPGGRFGFAEYLAQWPAFETVIPAAMLHTAYAVPTVAGGLRADCHDGAPFCFGPYLKLPAGHYTIRLCGDTGPDVAFNAWASRYVGARHLVICDRSWQSEEPLSGVIAELEFDCHEAMYMFEIVIHVERREVKFELSGVEIASRQPWLHVCDRSPEGK